MRNIEWAVFDLDGTLCTTPVIVHISRRLEAEEHARSEEHAVSEEHAWSEEHARNQVEEYKRGDCVNADVSARFAMRLRGKHRETLMTWLNTIDYVGDIGDAVKSLNNAGIRCALSTVTFDFAAEHCATRFVFERYDASELEYDAFGVCTGKVRHARESSDKQRDLEGLCRQYGVGEDRVVYIGDGASDIDAVRWSSQSIAFNSDCDDVRSAATTAIRSHSLLDVSDQIIRWQDSRE